MPRLLKTEQPHHVQAFERYFALGDSRSYELVARELNASLTTVKLWGRSFRWTERVQKRDLEMVQQIAERTASNQLSSTDRNLKIVLAALVRVAKEIAGGNLKQIAELKTLIHLEEHLMGVTHETSPTPRTGERARAGSYDAVIVLPSNGRGAPRVGDGEGP